MGTTGRTWGIPGTSEAAATIPSPARGAISSAGNFTSENRPPTCLATLLTTNRPIGGPYWGWWGEEAWPRIIGTASTLPDTPSNDISGDNEGGGGPALSSLIAYARTQYP